MITNIYDIITLAIGGVIGWALIMFIEKRSVNKRSVRSEEVRYICEYLCAKSITSSINRKILFALINLLHKRSYKGKIINLFRPIDDIIIDTHNYIFIIHFIGTESLIIPFLHIRNMKGRKEFINTIKYLANDWFQDNAGKFNMVEILKLNQWIPEIETMNIFLGILNMCDKPDTFPLYIDTISDENFKIVKFYTANQPGKQMMVCGVKILSQSGNTINIQDKDYHYLYNIEMQPF